MNVKNLVPVLAILVASGLFGSGLVAQEVAPARKDDAEQQEAAKSEGAREELPRFKANFDAPAQPKVEESDIVAEMEAKIKELGKKVNQTEQERAVLLHLRSELRAAKQVRQQFQRAKPAKVDRSPSDIFVVAKLEVQPNGNTLDVRFESLPGEVASIRNLVEFVLQTPSKGFRDFRIVSRHTGGTEAESALYEVRADYDKAKAQQDQYLKYVAQRRAELARLAASQRC